MDPDANYARQIELALLLIKDGQNDYDVQEWGTELAELVIALNDWVANGGFLPAKLSSTCPEEPMRRCASQDTLNCLEDYVSDEAIGNDWDEAVRRGEDIVHMLRGDCQHRVKFDGRCSLCWSCDT